MSQTNRRLASSDSTDLPGFRNRPRSLPSEGSFASRRSRLGWASTVLGAALLFGGCGGSAPSSSAQTPDELPPIALAEPGSAVPAPETFDVAALAARVTPVVVNISTKQRAESAPFHFFFGPDGGPGGGGPGVQTGAGTGFIIDANGYVVTNEHVVHDADEVSVILSDDRELPADVIGRDGKLDLALLKIRGDAELPSAVLGTSSNLRVGEHVLAVGNPFGLGHTVTLGIVSAKARTIGAGPYDNFIQTDASINPGNSGGPLFNWRGEVVGINTAIRAGADGIGFAIPIDALKDVLGQLREKGHVVRGKLGLMFQPLTPELAEVLGLDDARGALVAQLQRGSAAERAGIQEGDVILSVNGEAIQDADALPRTVAKYQPNTKVAISVFRKGRVVDLEAKLDLLDGGDKPPDPTTNNNPPAGSKLGLVVSDGDGGARIDRIEIHSPIRDLLVGDVILEANGDRVTDVASLKNAIEGASSGALILFRVRRGPMLRFSAVRVP